MNCKMCPNSSSKNPSLSFFRFPSDYNRCREWAERCNILHIFDRYGPIKMYKSFRICSDHFDCKYIVFDGRKRKLMNNAVPNSKGGKEIQTALESLQENADVRVAQKLLKNLCRFCAEENTDLIDIFSWKGKALELEEKIKVFPIKVNKLDKLPLQICNSCIVKISKFYDFVRHCVKADVRLKTILGIAENVALSNNLTREVPVNVQDKVNTILQDVLKPDKNFGCGYGEDSERSMQRNLFLVLQSDENCVITTDLPQELEKSEDRRCGSHLDNVLHIANTNFPYITSQEQVLMTKSNKLFGKKIIVSFEGNVALERYICNICSKTFNALEILESHWKAHSLKADKHGRFMCQNCNKIFPNKYRLNEHNRVHNGEYPFKCTVCEKKFHKMALLKQHSIVHESMKRFICSICNLRSSRKGNLIQHLRKHYRALRNENCNPFSQPNANFTNLEKSNNSQISKTISNWNTPQVKLKNNQTANDTCINAVKFICGICQTEYLDLKTLEQHFKDHANSLRKNYSLSCNSFNLERLSNSGNTDPSPFRHMKPQRNKQRMRSHQRTYQCEECGLRFKRKDTLTNHTRIHTGERPFVCGSCGFAFKQKGDCLKHERNHQKRSEGEFVSFGNNS